MKIVVVDTAASSGGAISILKDFYEYVRANDRRNDWVFVLSKPYLEETEHIQVALLPQVKQSRVKKLLFERFTGARWLSRFAPDLVFSLQNTAFWGLSVPQVVYLHQSIPFQDTVKFSFFRREEFQLAVYQYLIGAVIKRSLNLADAVIVQSRWMKEAVLRKTSRTEAEVHVVSPTVTLPQAEDSADNEPWERSRFFYPTSDAVYKNLRCLKEAKRLLCRNGKPEPEIRVTLPQGYEPDFECLGYLPREQVMEEYRRSTLVFPSYLETFGLPLLEARTVGSVILASDCPFSREVLEHYENAYFFDPFKPQELAELMRQVMDGTIVRRPSETGPKSPEPASGWKTVAELLTETARR